MYAELPVYTDSKNILYKVLEGQWHMKWVCLHQTVSIQEMNLDVSRTSNTDQLINLII